jgi:hypothetical protein
MNENPTKNFIHYEINEEVRAIGGGYTFIKEDRLYLDGRKVLFFIGHAVFDTSCCGSGGCGYAIVPGFVTAWKIGKSDSGRFISRVESITDADLQNKIRNILKQKEMVRDVRFE